MPSAQSLNILICLQKWSEIVSFYMKIQNFLFCNILLFSKYKAMRSTDHLIFRWESSHWWTLKIIKILCTCIFWGQHFYQILKGTCYPKSCKDHCAKQYHMLHLMSQFQVSQFHKGLSLSLFNHNTPYTVRKMIYLPPRRKNRFCGCEKNLKR